MSIPEITITNRVFQKHTTLAIIPILACKKINLHVLLMGSLNLSLDLDDLVRINRPQLYMEPKVSILQANA